MTPVYKFRGKTPDNMWVFGNLVNGSNGTFILTEGYEIGAESWQPEYHSSGMGCGLEDRNIKDRYEAMEHGWEKAVERFNEMIPEFIKVLPETVGQFVGLNDKNGKEIYDGDKVKWNAGWTRKNENGGVFENIVEFRNTMTENGWIVRNGSFSKKLTKSGVINSKCEVIGNIHDKIINENDTN